MVYKKFIKRDGKVFGPYYYESYRDSKGHVKTRFISGPKKTDKINLFSSKKMFLFIIGLGIIFAVTLLLFLGNLSYNARTTGRVIDSNPSFGEMQIAEQIADNSITSNVDVRDSVDLEVKDVPLENNKIMEFSTPNGKIELNFDLLNYSEFVKTETEDIVEASGFDINVTESKEKYKWGYNVKLTDLNFIARIDVTSNQTITVIDNQTLRIGEAYLSFADLASQGYTLSINSPVLLNESLVVNETIVINETNVTELNSSNITEVVTNISIGNESEGLENVSVENETIVISNETESGENISVGNETTNVVINESIGEDSYEDNSSEVPIENAPEDTSLEQTPSENTNVEKTPVTDEVPTEEITETAQPTVTEEALSSISGFVVHGVYGLTGFVVSDSELASENTVSVYVQRNFEEAEYNLGDIINLDPSLVFFEQSITYSMCYQETANASTVGDGTCGLNYSGRYGFVGFWNNLNNTYDGNWSTMGLSTSGFIYINYTKPLGAQQNSLWQIEDLATSNLTILQSCWDYDSLRLQLRVAVSDTSGEWDCNNGTWASLRTVGMGIAVYEEAMIWNVSNNTYAYSVSSCQKLTQPGIYTMTQSLSGSQIPLTGCFNITSSNVTLDCNNYYIRNNTLGVNGIYAGYGISNVTVKNCNVSLGPSSSYGILFDRVNNSFIINSTFISNAYGTTLDSSSNNNQIINNTFSLTTGESISLYAGSNNNQFINNSITSTLFGISLYSSSNNSFTSNHLRNCTESMLGCIYAYDSFNNLFSGGLINGSLSNLFYFEASSNNVFRDLNLSGAVNNDTYFDLNSANNTFINISYNLSKEYASSGSSLIRKWYYQLYVNDTSGNNISNINITAYNSSGSVEFSGLMTNSSGWTNITTITEYVNNGGTRSYYSNYTINATNSSYSTTSHTYNVTFLQNNNLKDVFTLSSNLSCGVISSPGVYYMDRSLSGAQIPAIGCFNITSSNVLLDCNGYAISNASLGFIGIYAANVVNVTIKNCTITTNSSGEGVWFNYVNHSFILDSNIIGSNYGIDLYSSSNNNLSKNTVSSCWKGIYFYLSSNNSLNRCIATSNTAGLYTEQSSRNSFTNSNFDSNSLEGLWIVSSNYNNFSNLSAIGNDFFGVYLVSSSNNTLFNITSSLSGYVGVYLNSGSNNNSLSDISVVSNGNGESGVGGLIITNSNYNNISKVISLSNDPQGIYLESSSYNNLSRCNSTGNNDVTYGTGILLNSASNYNLISDSYAYSNYVAGIRTLNSASYNQIKNCTSAFNTMDGIALQAEYNNVTNSSVFSNNRCGFALLLGSSNEILINTTASNSSFSDYCLSWNSNKSIFINSNSFSSRGFGFRLNGVSDNIFINSSVNSSANNAFEMATGNVNSDNGLTYYSGNNSLRNFLVFNTSSSYNDLNLFQQSDQEIILQNVSVGKYAFLGSGALLRLIDPSYGQILFKSAVNGTGFNFSGDIRIRNNSAYVNSSQIGLNKSANLSISNLPVFNHPVILKDTATCLDCYNFTSLNAGNVTFNVSSWSNYSVQEDSSYLVPGNVSRCGIIDTSGTYTLTANVTSSSTCFNITSDNVTVDGNSFTINYSSDGAFGYGVFVNGSNNITVKNANIKEGKVTGTSRPAIYLVSSNYSKLQNNTISTLGFGSTAIGLVFGSNNNLVTLNTISTTNSMGTGIYLSWYSNNNNLSLNNVTVSGTAALGIDTSRSSNNALISNRLTTFGTAGVGISLSPESSNNTISLNTVSTNISSAPGIVLGSGSNNTFNSNTLNVSKSDRISISSLTSDIVFINNSIINRNSSYYDINFGSSGINGTWLIDQYFENYTFYEYGGTLNVRDSRFGEIRFTSTVNGSGFNLSRDVQIRNNSAFVNSSKIGLNKSANITIYNLPLVSNHLAILKDGAVCSDCYNFTSLNVANVTFNVSSWSNYSINEDPLSIYPGNISRCGAIGDPGVYTLTGNILQAQVPLKGCINITTSNVIFDCQNHYILNTSLNVSGIYAGSESGITNVTVRNCNVTMPADGYGIWFDRVNNSFIFNNTVDSNLWGIYTSNSSNNSIINNKGAYNFLALILASSSGNNISFNNFSGQSYMNFGADLYFTGHGIGLSQSNLNSITSNNLSEDGYGIEIVSSVQNNITNNYISIDGYGIVITNGSKNNISGNIADYNYVFGIILQVNSSNNTVGNNSACYNLEPWEYNGVSRGNGITVSTFSNYNNVSNNNISSNLRMGIYVYLSERNNLSGNNISLNRNGIEVDYSYYNLIEGGSIINNIDDGITLYSNGYTFFDNVFVNTTSDFSGDGMMWIFNSSNNTFSDMFLDNNGSIISGFYTGSANNTFTNVSYNSSKEYVESGSSLIRKWYYQVYVNDSNGNSVIDANVTAYNSSNAVEFSALTLYEGPVSPFSIMDLPPEGRTGFNQITEYKNTGNTSTGINRTYASNYTIFAKKAGVGIGNKFFNLTSFGTNVIDTLTINNNLSSCTVIDVSGSYSMSRNLLGAQIPSTGCFNITSSNVLLDCKGFYILNSSIEGVGIYAGSESGLTNITVKNCNVTMKNTGSGVYFNLVNNSFIINNTLNSNAYGVTILGSNNQIINNTVNLNSNNGIDLGWSLNNSIINNTANSNLFGIALSSSSNNQIINNTANSNGFSGISFISFSDNNNLTGNYINSNGYGISLSLSSKNIFTNNHIWNCTDPTYGCIYVSTSQNNSFTGGLINLSLSPLILINSDSNNNLFKDVTLLGAIKNDTFIASNSINNTFLNVSYNSSKEYVESGSSLIRKWYYQAYVNHTEGGMVNNASVYAANSSDYYVFNTTTNASGWIPVQILTQYINNGTINYVDIYMINATNITDSDGHYYNVSAYNGNNFNDVFTVNDTTVPYSQGLVDTFVCEGNSLSLYFNVTDLGWDLPLAGISPINPFYSELLSYINLTSSEQRIFSGVLSKEDAGGVNNQSKTHNVTVTLYDGVNTNSTNISITVIETNEQPSMENFETAYNVIEGDRFYHPVLVNDTEDGNSSLGNLYFNMTGANFTDINSSGILNILTNSSLRGSYTIEVCATDKGILNPHENISSVCLQDGTNKTECKSFILNIVERGTDNGNTGGGNRGGGGGGGSGGASANNGAPGSESSEEENIYLEENSTFERPNPFCGNWTACKAVYNLSEVIDNQVFFRGEQKRECKLEGGEVHIEKRGCASKVNIVVKRKDDCFKNYLVVLDANNNTVSRLEFVSGDRSKLNVQLLFDKSAYCPYCYDQMKDYDETGVDCGGSCSACTENPIRVYSNFGTILFFIILVGVLICGNIVILLITRYHLLKSEISELRLGGKQGIN